jgi:hypothetical protein
MFDKSLGKSIFSFIFKNQSEVDVFGTFSPLDMAESQLEIAFKISDQDDQSKINVNSG